MKIGCFAVLFGEKKFDEAAKIIADLGCEAIEIGTGNFPGNSHCNPVELLKDESKIRDFKKITDDYNLEITALSCHGNSLHPNKEIARIHHETHQNTIKLANKLGVKTVVNFAGCPGANEDATIPAWNVCAWPDDFNKSLKWQWEEKVIPYWKKESKFAEDYNVQIAFEPHPGFVVYNSETMLRLRNECGKNLGVNLDPSHLFWQGMDPIRVTKALKDLIFHVHAKDCRLDPDNTTINGVLDTKPYGDEFNRSWIFRTVGYGHGLEWWKNFVSTLRLVGYDYVLSIEHEDSLMSREEGLTKAFETLKQAVITKKPGEMYWA